MMSVHSVEESTVPFTQQNRNFTAIAMIVLSIWSPRERQYPSIFRSDFFRMHLLKDQREPYTIQLDASRGNDKLEKKTFPNMRYLTWPHLSSALKLKVLTFSSPLLVVSSSKISASQTSILPPLPPKQCVSFSWYLHQAIAFHLEGHGIGIRIDTIRVRRTQ